MLKRFRLLIIALGLILGAGLLWRVVGPMGSGGPSAVKLPPGQPPAIPLGAGPEELPVQVRVHKVALVPFSDTLPVTGTIRGQAEIPLKFEINGVVKAVHFSEGELVQAGEAIAVLEDRDMRLRLEHAQSKLAASQADVKLVAQRLTIHEQLFRIGAIIQAKLDEAKLEVEKAQAQAETTRREVALAQADLGNTSLNAPTNGVIGAIEVEPGEYVTPQSDRKSTRLNS